MTTIEYYHNLDKYKSNSLSHYGTRGQKWGVRHWQNPDGTFNEEGKIRYFGAGKSRDSVDYENGPAKYDSAEALFEEIQMDSKVIAKRGFVIIDFKIRNNF